jgi:hypothetical protein
MLTPDWLISLEGTSRNWPILSLPGSREMEGDV